MATAISTILVILKETTEEIEKLVKDAQNEQLEQVQRMHMLNIAQAKTLTARKYVEDAISVNEAETKQRESDMVELGVLRKIQYGGKK